MKTKYVFILFIIISVFSCSKDESDMDEPVATITRCFTVKEIGTLISISGARVILSGDMGCGGYGCGYSVIGNNTTDLNGEVCFTINEIQNEEIWRVQCFMEGYIQFEINDPSLDFSEIYLEPISP